MTQTEAVDLDAIEARAAAATPGPWATRHVDDGQFYGQAATFDIVTLAGGREEGLASGGFVEDGGPVLGAMEGCDAEFIAHAREDVPRLLEELRRTEGDLGVAVAEAMNYSSPEPYVPSASGPYASGTATEYAARIIGMYRERPNRYPNGTIRNHDRTSLAAAQAAADSLAESGYKCEIIQRTIAISEWQPFLVPAGPVAEPPEQQR